MNQQALEDIGVAAQMRAAHPTFARRAPAFPYLRIEEHS
jgi:hypothetical protein